MSDQAIGVFDSGIGGLTIAKAIAKCLPGEDILYFGDTAHLPYGDKSPELVRLYSEQIVYFLLEKKCKLIVIACNTASSYAYAHLKQKFGERIKLMNVVDPLIQQLQKIPSIQKIGVIGTRGTIDSGVYPREIAKVLPGVEVIAKATPLLAPMIESGFFHNKISQEIIESYLSDDQFKNLDAILLACTHYPRIKSEINQFFRGKVEVFDSTDFTQKAVKAYLKKQDLLNEPNRKGQHYFYLSDNSVSFGETAKILFGTKIGSTFIALNKL